MYELKNVYMLSTISYSTIILRRKWISTFVFMEIFSKTVNYNNIHLMLLYTSICISQLFSLFSVITHNLSFICLMSFFLFIVVYLFDVVFQSSVVFSITVVFGYCRFYTMMLFSSFCGCLLVHNAIFPLLIISKP